MFRKHQFFIHSLTNKLHLIVTSNPLTLNDDKYFQSIIMFTPRGAPHPRQSYHSFSPEIQVLINNFLIKNREDDIRMTPNYLESRDFPYARKLFSSSTNIHTKNIPHPLSKQELYSYLNDHKEQMSSTTYDNILFLYSFFNQSFEFLPTNPF